MSKGIGGSTAEAELAALKPWPSPAPAITAEERAQRLAKAQSILAHLNADAMIVGAGASLRYFTGVGWNATERLVAMVLPRAGAPVMICPRFELGSLEAGRSADRSRPSRSGRSTKTPTPWSPPKLRKLGAGIAWPSIQPCRSSPSTACARPPRTSAPLDGAPVIDGCRMIKSSRRSWP